MKQHANHLEFGDPILITHNGKPRFVLQDAQNYEHQQQNIALFKLINLSENLQCKARPDSAIFWPCCFLVVLMIQINLPSQKIGETIEQC